MLSLKELEANKKCVQCKITIDKPVDEQEITGSSKKTIAMWNKYCSNCRIVYKCHICQTIFLEDEDTYWKDICSSCHKDVCCKCRDPASDTDYDDHINCIECSKE